MILHTKISTLVFAYICLALSVDAIASEYQTKSYTLHEHGSITVVFPNKWKDSVQQAPDDFPSTINFKARSGLPFDVLITPLWAFNNSAPMSDEKVYNTVTNSLSNLKGAAVEKNIVINEIIGSHGKGYYFSITDKDPKPNEYKYLSQGIIKVNELTVTFTILTNDGQSEIVNKAIRVIKKLTQNQT